MSSARLTASVARFRKAASWLVVATSAGLLVVILAGRIGAVERQPTIALINELLVPALGTAIAFVLVLAAIARTRASAFSVAACLLLAAWLYGGLFLGRRGDTPGASGCVFRSNPISDSDPIRSPIPMNPITDSDESDQLVMEASAAAA